MPFIPYKLIVLSRADRFTMWRYDAGDDTITEVTDPDYFLDAGDKIRPKDMMLVSTADAGAQLYFPTGFDSGRIMAFAAPGLHLQIVKSED